MSELGPLRLRVEVEHWPLVTPFRITGYTWETADLVVVTLQKDDHVGRGEAMGVYYKNETAASIVKQIEAVRKSIEAGISRESLQHLLPCGGARNALDCALWDLEAKLTRRPAWQIAQLNEPVPLRATFSFGADDPEKMASAARGVTQARAIKLKLTGESVDADRVRAVRNARPDVWLNVDANQGFSIPSLERLMPVLVECNVDLIEQPFAVGQEHLLDGFQSPIPIAADESLQGLDDLSGIAGRFNVANIKLDKCGGLTEALKMARLARELGLDTMVGNMFGTSLSTAPGFLLGQLCSIVDLDGPTVLKSDRAPSVNYVNGLLECPRSLWGY
jgi:L-Ala-D/L-Glu epimerase